MPLVAALGRCARSGDTAAEVEAEKAMATLRHWPILHEMAKEGAYSEVVWEIAKWMPKGYLKWSGHKIGLPLLPKKRKIHTERDGMAASI